MSTVVHRYSHHGYPCCAQAAGPPPAALSRCGGPPMCKRCKEEFGGCPARTPAPHHPETVNNVHRYSRHGWPCCAQVTPAAVALAKCGGPAVCQECGRQVAACPARVVPGGVDFALLETIGLTPHDKLAHVPLPDHLHAVQQALHQAIAAHHLLDQAGVPAAPGFHGDLDVRVWQLAAEMAGLRERLARIGEHHHKAVDAHGGSDGCCRECGLRWPCPTHVWATTRRGVCDLWDDRFTV